MAHAACFLPAVELARLVREGELSPVELVDASLARIDERNGALNAFVTRLDDAARAGARAAEEAVTRARREGPDAVAALGPLVGLPVV